LRWCSDERLAQLAADGDARGLALLYERHHQALYRYCRSIVRNEHDAQDALQATMTGALGALGRLEPGVPVRAWLFRIAHNASISLVRQRRTSVAAEDVPDPISEPIEATLARRAELAVLVADLQDLPERQRAALVMRELSGLAHEEIGIALSISTGAAKQAIFEARSALAEFAEGRTMACDDVRRAISDGDGRVLRGRGVRAHLRDCSGCADFRAQIPVRRASLATLAPQLPAAASAGGLAHLLGGGHGSHSGLGAAAGAKAASAPLGAKLLVTGLVVAAAAGGVTHSGLLHHPAQHSRATAAAPAAANRAEVSPGRAARLALRSGRKPAASTPNRPQTARGGRASSGQAVTAADPISTDTGRPAPEATSASGLVTGAQAAGSGRAGRGPATPTPRRPAARGPGSSGGKGKRAHTARSSGAATSATRRSTRVPAAKRSADSASATSATPTSTPPPRATQAPSPPAPGQPAPAGQGSGGAH
jgi:RNA polymerase sigma factor (sigma-70 family)